MSRRRKIGWFTRIVKVVASVIAFLTWTSHLVTTVDGADKSENPHVVQELVEETSNVLSTFGDDAEVSVDTESFSLQKHSADSNCDVSYILVSTIDGRVSALDLQKKGTLVWSVQADTRPLYSSSLANMEMIRNGKKMRLIPSLDGALYQFDGDKVEAIPLSAETLLSTTYRLGDDSMIVGSKDLRNFGVNLHTGEVQFTCGSEGCSNYEGKMENKPMDGSSTIVLTRSTQVVRSVDVKNGIEKWNFSVGQHQLSLPSPTRPSEIDDTDDDNSDKEGYSIPSFTSFSDECSEEENYSDDINYDNYLQLIVPEGRVVALNKGDFSQVLWEHKFDSPIAKAWLLRHGKLESMSLFDGRNIPTLRSLTPEDADNRSMLQPLLYIGSHNKHLYIQASPQLESILKTYTKNRIGHFIEPNVKVSWRPYPNTATSTADSVFGGTRPQITQNQNKAGQEKREESTSLAVWHEDYPFDTGYFLYPEIKDTRPTLAESEMLLEHHHPRDLEEGWLPVSLWQYWKEVAFISMAMSVLVHFVLTRFLAHDQSLLANSSEASASDISNNSNSSRGLIIPDNTALPNNKLSTGEYVSRFASDFDCLHCLGKGGFGVVFEAVNKVDDQHYAVKRTMLPRSEGAKEKVLREVRALAKLEHTGIVRYFNAWVESPPAGWQEERDKLFSFSDVSGPTSRNSAASFTGQHQSESEHIRVNSRKLDKRRRNKVDSQDRYPHLSPVKRAEALLETDSVLFSSDVVSCDCQLRQSGSGEFSVRTNVTESSDESETSFISPRGKLFSLDANALNESQDFSGDSRSESRSSIPFSNYTSNSSGVMSHKADHSHQELSGDSVVFESSSNEPCGKNKSWEETRNSVDDSIVFEKSSMSEDRNSEKMCKQGLLLRKQDHHTVDIFLLPDKSESSKEDSEPVNQSSPAGARFFLYIQMQLYSKETLKDWLGNNTLNRDRYTVLNIFDQIVCAVNYVHSQGLMHRDLKPSNIFFTADGIVKVGDFGLVTALSVQQDQEAEIDDTSLSRHTAEVGTTLYMSPEQIAKKPYDLKIDIFSLGLIFLELWIPFSTQMERVRTLLDAKRHIFPARFNRELPSESELVHKMTSSDPTLRPFTEDILDHPLFKEFAPTRMGKRHHKRTVSSSSTS